MMLNEHWEKFDAASTGEQKVRELFSVIRLCGNQAIPIPEWANVEFHRASNAWFSLRVGSLDDAFDVKTITNTRLGQKREARRIRWTALLRVKEYEEDGISVPWEELANEIGTSVGTLKRRYYEISSLKFW